MADEYKKKKIINEEHDTDDESGTGSGSIGGSSGQIEFRDFLGTGENIRDDQLSAGEKKHLLIVHVDTHAARVKKQKELLEQRAAVKEGKISVRSYRQGMGGAGGSSQYKANPILANKVQFSGIDRQVNALPTENIAETNEDKRNELEYQLRLENKPEYTPKFNPKPQFR